MDRFHKVKPGMPDPGQSNLTAEDVNSIFEDAVCEFGIDKSWIQRKVLHTDQSGEATYNYTVKVPTDLPVTLILNELNSRLLEHGLSISAKELRKEKTTKLQILHVKNIMLQADLVTDPSVVRSTATIGFIIKDIEKLNDRELTEFLSLPEYFTLALSPSEKAEKAVKQILALNKEYIIILGDNIDEVRFKFDEDYSEKRLNTSVRTILGTFGGAKLYLIDDESDLYKSPLYVTVKTAFEKRKLSLNPLSNFTEIKSRADQDLESMFSYCCQSSASGQRVYTITAKNFLELKDLVDLYRKKGYRFVFPSQLNFGMAPKPEEEQAIQNQSSSNGNSGKNSSGKGSATKATTGKSSSGKSPSGKSPAGKNSSRGNQQLKSVKGSQAKNPAKKSVQSKGR
ncbi:MAG: hypothetical protein HF314_04865 [Ignavibacteria bacterium]|nr:hypothetical protein [Ignavibacteria bacterium]MCU7502381.1 hypothetical protein [Ignavibacteria bacterium]MCU7515054.1 hypothetical protein [Ignavibacteria bacterium]